MLHKTLSTLLRGAPPLGSSDSGSCMGGGVSLKVTRRRAARATLPCRQAPRLVYVGRRYLGAVLGCYLHDPPLRVRQVLQGERPSVIAVRRPTRLLEEELVQTPGSLGNQHPAHVIADVLGGLQSTPGHVDKGARARLNSVVIDHELVLPFEYVVGFVLAVMDVGWRP